LAKKLYKEEKELLKAKTTLKAAVDAIPAAALTPELVAALGAAVPNEQQQAEAPPVSAVGEAGPGSSSLLAASLAEGAQTDGTLSTATAAATMLTSSTAEKILAAKRDVMQMAVNVGKTVQEKEKLVRAITTETHLHKEVFRWMSAMQELLWPDDEQKIALGRPVGPTAPPVTSNSSSSSNVNVLAYNRSLLRLLPALLPVGLAHMEKAAALVGIQGLDDVALTLEAFRWMGWANLCLHLLRNPPTTTALKKLLEAPQVLCPNMADDKIIKLLSGVLQRVK
jgi:hypothetical protein